MRVFVAVRVGVGVLVGVGVFVGVRVIVGVVLGVSLGVCVIVGVLVGVAVHTRNGQTVGVQVRVGVHVGGMVEVRDGVKVIVGVIGFRIRLTRLSRAEDDDQNQQAKPADDGILRCGRQLRSTTAPPGGGFSRGGFAGLARGRGGTGRSDR